MPKIDPIVESAEMSNEAARRQNARNRASFLISIPKWAAYAVIAWQVRLSIEAMTGANATPSLLMRIGREVSYWEIVCWLAGALGVLAGLYSRHLLRRQVDKDALNTAILEKRLMAAGSSPIAHRPASSKE
jgi:hypothetical protein